jgi:hypothetical protein
MADVVMRAVEQHRARTNGQHRPGPCAAAHLVDAGDRARARRGELALDLISGRRGHAASLGLRRIIAER